MSFHKQIRDHYDGQSLPADKVASILAQGRKAAAEGEAGEKVTEFPAARRKPLVRQILALAAIVALSATGFWWMRRDEGRVSYAMLPPRIIDFFAHEPDLKEAPQEKHALHEMLVAHGAPKDFEIPAPLMKLESAACSVVDVQGEKTWLSCYWRENMPNRGPHELIHLLVARTSDFYDQPKSAKPVTQEMDGWTFASWTKGDAIYTLATAAPMEKMTPFLSRIERENPGLRFQPGEIFRLREMAAIMETPGHK